MHSLIRTPWLAVCLVAAALLGAGSTQAAYVFTEVARPGADSTSLFDINDSGAMVGYSSSGGGLANETRGFVTNDGVSFTELTGPAGAVASFALGISDGGAVVGSYYKSKSLDIDGNLVYEGSGGFFYSGNIYTIFDAPGATDTFLRGISPDGRYWSGYYVTAAQPGVGFVYDSLTGILQVIATPDSSFTIMQGINTSRIVVGSDRKTDGTRPGVLFDIDTGTRTEASVAGAFQTALRSIEDDGTLAGWFRDAAGEAHGFIGSVASFEQIDYVGAVDTFVEGGNDTDVLVGNALVGEAFRAFVARPVNVPEPAGLALVAIAGLAATLATRRRRPA